MYLWLKQGSEGQANALGMRVKHDDMSDLSFIQYYEALDSASAPIRQDLMALVERVTLRDSIHPGLHCDGVYHRDGCELTARSRLLGSSSLGDPDIEMQDLSISGPTVEAVEKMYSLFLEGKLGEPDVNWEPSNARPAQNSEVCQLLREILREIEDFRSMMHLK